MKHDWKLVRVLWKPGGRPYTYLLPPELGDLVPGDTALVRTPTGTGQLCVIAEIQDLTPMPYLLKPVANGWPAAQISEWREEDEATGQARALQPSLDFPAWELVAMRFSSGEDINARDGSA